MPKNSLEDFRTLVYYRGALWACYSDIKHAAPDVAVVVLKAFNELTLHIDSSVKQTGTHGRDEQHRQSSFATISAG